MLVSSNLPSYFRAVLMASAFLPVFPETLNNQPKKVTAILTPLFILPLVCTSNQNASLFFRLNWLLPENAYRGDEQGKNRV